MSEPVHTAERLKELQALPLDRKIQISQARIIGERGEKGSFPIKFCPRCGRKLKGERNEQT